MGRTNEVAISTIKKDFPEEWELLQERVKKKRRSGLPTRIRDDLKHRARKLLGGRVIDFGPTKKYPFVVKCVLSWDEDDFCDFREQSDIVAPKGANPAQRAMIKYLDGQQIFEEIYDTVMKSSAVKAYNKEIKAFCKEGEALEKNYDFDFQTILEEEQYR